MGKLNTRHYTYDNCKQGEEWRLLRETLKRCFGESKFLFQNNAEALPLSEAFPCLGRKITYNNSDWAVVYQNLRKARRRWGVI